jgi:hypothetical protein
MPSTRCLSSVLISALLLLTSGCSAEQIRRATYPRDFHYITQSQIRGTMTSLGAQIEAMDEIMEQEDGPRPEDRERIIELLTEMNALARQLKTGTRSNHPRIDRAAPWLQEDIRRALHGARHEPPNYYYAGQVAGACEYCHVPRHGTEG